ncbi:hypothetical protein KBP30_25800 [Streptomyces sp. Go40/10]|uniref:hypothetical protein n=1 Tax=Streptomyces sp. Go40/10 TaxID=2825844 RepID=UPI001E397336|nr:hypothetical protein [Streptomyces sp. Go40/10]UFR04370.1 hypothetical protein KBP30_25800 [Streptomyces sp. Go40/10]
MKTRVVTLLTAALLVSGCGFVGDGAGEGRQEKPVKENHMNMQEAGDRAEEMLDAFLGAIHPSVEVIPGASSASACSDFKNDSTGTGSVTRRRAVVTIISSERRGNFLGVVERYWKKHGYKITSVVDNKEMPAIYATAPNDFRVALEFGYAGQANFVVVSPCVTESKVTEPSRKPVDPEAFKSEGLPYLHSDFWSLKAPVPSSSPST